MGSKYRTEGSLIYEETDGIADGIVVAACLADAMEGAVRMASKICAALNRDAARQSVQDAIDNGEIAIKRMVAILNRHGITMRVDGCGCCGSPNVFFAYRGKTVLDEDDACFATDAAEAQS